MLRGEDELLGHVIFSQDVHRLYGGVVPELASRAHLRTVDDVVDGALAEAGVAPARTWTLVGGDRRAGPHRGAAGGAAPGGRGRLGARPAAGGRCTTWRPTSSPPQLERPGGRAHRSWRSSSPAGTPCSSGCPPGASTASWAPRATTRPARRSTRPPSCSASPTRAARPSSAPAGRRRSRSASRCPGRCSRSHQPARRPRVLRLLLQRPQDRAAHPRPRAGERGRAREP